MSILLAALLLTPPDPAAIRPLLEGPAEPPPAPVVSEEAATDNPPPEFLLHLGLGGNVLIAYAADFRYQAYGPSLRVGAWGSNWKGHFNISGGGTLHWSYLTGPTANERLNFFTLQGDLAMGGGTYEKFLVYGHLTLGAGVLAGREVSTGTKVIVPGIRMGGGVGGYGYVTPRISVGMLFDSYFYWLNTVGLDILLTTNIHFGMGTKT